MQYKVQIHNYVQNHKDEIVETLKELIKIPSVRSEVEENAPFEFFSSPKSPRLVDFLSKVL